MNADVASMMAISPMAVSDKNLYAYCDNNPIMRVDTTGAIWETVFDVISLGASAVEVCMNPDDPWAWAGLVGDAIDLIPVVTGVGEIARGIKVTRRAITSAAEHAKPNKLNNMMGDTVVSISWMNAPDTKTAFIYEYLIQKSRGGVLSASPDLKTYNKIWSPGRNYLR